MFVRLVAASCTALLLLIYGAFRYHIIPATPQHVAALLLVLHAAFARLSHDRWALIRRHPWPSVRHIYQSIAIYRFAHKLDRAVDGLPPLVDASDPHPGADAILDSILSAGPDTFQKKPTNRVQIESLLGCVCDLVTDVREQISAKEASGVVEGNGARTTTQPLIMDIGAGKGLFTRALYEALDRTVPVVAFDSRVPGEGDRFYDPPPQFTCSTGEQSGCAVDENQQEQQKKQKQQQQPYTRVVADVRHLSSSSTLASLRPATNGGLIAVTKHLCGGATDASLVALCRPPLSNYTGACCLAPCCHQKTTRDQYCNLPYLRSMGFCSTHVGLRGGSAGAVKDNDFRTFGMLISISKLDELRHFDYKKSTLLKVLGFRRAAQLGRKARRLLEEGRMRYLRQRGGFDDVWLVRYCNESVTGDNLAIVARKIRRRCSAA